ncbi:hypothetical protein CYL18_08650 [Pradoshia eiseniae]|uniref:DUF3784 domain-containing protein n=1 Tax=Pradoshia eiseniae TaxID=2064768 RepID=A0A2S7MZZ8_9BACI|nr:hypothetical protein [Pradoshia eiseniae]PQD95349.1 hypothetical protein CYL18_08650 [Pradoshia eiseniae]
MTVLIGIAFCSLIILAGVYIWRKGTVNFIAGYEEGIISDEKGLAKRIGLVTMAFGTECLLLLLVNLYFLPLEAFYIGVLAILNIIIILFLIIEARI